MKPELIITIVFSIITIVISTIGLTIAILSFIHSYKNNARIRKLEEDRFHKEQEEKLKKEKLERPQFSILSSDITESYNESRNDEFDIDAVFLPYKNLTVDADNFSPLYPKGGNEEGFIKVGKKKIFKTPICEYYDIFEKKTEWVSWIIELENTGKSNIQFYYLLTTMERSGSLIENSEQWHKTVTVTRRSQYVVSSKKALSELEIN